MGSLVAFALALSPKTDLRSEKRARLTPDTDNGTMTTTLSQSSSTQRLAGKYLTFAIAQESYGLDVLQVREIIRLTSITVVPQVPDYVSGVINLRGKIIPVVDLRLRFGIAAVKNTDQTCIIVVQVKFPDGKTSPMGMIVDGVEEVVSLAGGDIEETPDFGHQEAAGYILGMAKVKGAVKTLLNINCILTADSALHLTAATSPAA
jgi:purine-binding chemotaxis protein CheW